MKHFKNSIMTIRTYTSRIEPWWTLVFTPIIQETMFRLIPYQFWYIRNDDFWTIGIISSLCFALIHWYFGKWFMLYSFAWGFILWWIMVSFGFIPAVLVHSVLNFFHIRFNLLTPKSDNG